MIVEDSKLGIMQENEYVLR